MRRPLHYPNCRCGFPLLLERLDRVGVFVGVQDFQFSILELFNCPRCSTTLSRRGIGPVTAEEETP
jgi:hypothetical protein